MTVRIYIEERHRDQVYAYRMQKNKQNCLCANLLRSFNDAL